MTTMNHATVQELQTRLAEAEASNAELALRLAGSEATPARRRTLRAVVPVLLILLGTLLTPVAVIGGWSRVVLTDTDAFVATYAPLAYDQRLRDYITDQVMAAVEQHVDIDAVVGQAIDGLSELATRPAAATALQALREPAVQGVRSSIRQATDKVVSSEAFARVWEQSLRLSHGQTIAALRGDTAATMTITAEGLGLRIGPIIQQVREALSAQGFALAERIPVIDKTIVVARADQLAQAVVAYRSSVAIGYWLPVLVVLLLAGGVLAAVRRHRAAVWAAAGFGAGALLVLVGLSVGRTVAALAVPPSLMPPDVLQLFYDTVVHGLADIAAAALTLAIAAGITIWLTGPFTRARKLRTLGTDTQRVLQAWADQHGFATGRAGVWLHAQRMWLRAGVGVAAIVALLAVRPLSVGEVLAIAASALAVLVVVALCERRAEPGAAGVADTEAGS